MAEGTGTGTGRIGLAAALAELKVAKRFDAWSRERMTTFFEHIAETANIRGAAAAARFDVSSAYRRRDSDPTFRRCWDEALSAGVERLETAAMAEAMAEVGRAAAGGQRADLGRVTRVLAARDAREKRRGEGPQVACMPIDELERLLMRRLAAVAKRLARLPVDR